MKKVGLLLILVIAITNLLCACAPLPPDIPTMGRDTAVIYDDDMPSSDPPATFVPFAQPTGDLTSYGEPKELPTSWGQHTEIKRVETFIDATLPMMGFVDTVNASGYVTYVDCALVAIAQCFPNATQHAYRVDVDQPKEDTEIPGGLSTTMLEKPSFFLSADMEKLPEVVRAANGETTHSGERMNEFRQSFYNANSLSAPSNTTQLLSPAAWALQNTEEGTDNFTVLITDLSEIQTNYSALVTAIRDKAFAKNKTAGIIALRCGFSGLVPANDGSIVWYEWGALPKGALWKMLDYGPYSLGISIDPDTRSAKLRPFYIICVGDSDAVNSYVHSVEEQMANRFPQSIFSLDLLAFDIDFRVKGASIAQKVTQLTNSYDHLMDGLNPLPISGQKLDTVQLQHMVRDYHEESNPRYLEYQVRYPTKMTDPRITSGRGFLESDFVAAYKLSISNDDGSKMIIDDPQKDKILPSIEQVSQDDTDVIVTIRLAFPYEALERSIYEYEAEISLLLNPPTEILEPNWVRSYHTDVNLLQNFDGSRTVGLAGVFSSISSMQRSIIESQQTNLGSFTINIIAND